MNDNQNWDLDDQSPWYEPETGSVVFAICSENNERYVIAVWDGAINDYAHQEDTTEKAIAFFNDNKEAFLNMALRLMNEDYLEDNKTYIPQETFDALFQP